jgi:transposase
VLLGTAAGVDAGTLRGIAELGQVAGAAAVTDYSREQEFEADALAVDALARAGYDPAAAADFLESLQAQSEFQARIAGRQSPHRWRQFKLSNDPAFAEKLRDVVGLYVAPPAHAVVLSVDEKSQIQALDRTQPGLPLKKGRGPTLTHDYKRHGTTTLFAALNVLTGEVMGRNMARHRNQEFIRFLNLIERDVPAGKVIHVILDNYAAHKHAKVRAWLERHPRWTFHFIPTSSSWLNAVEGFFAKLTRRRLKHGVFHSVIDLQAAINRFIAEHNGGEAKPFTWRADPDAIINARNRGFQMLDSIH